MGQARQARRWCELELVTEAGTLARAIPSRRRPVWGLQAKSSANVVIATGP